MKKIRIGNDIVIKWRVTINGEEVNLEGLDLSLYISTTYQPRKAIAFTVAGNEITATYKGSEQRVTGVYRLTLYRNEGENAQSILDACDAFELVSCSCLTVDAAFGGAEVELPITDLGVGIPGLSAYEIACIEGFKGTQAEWLASLSAASEAAAAECREFTDAAKIDERERQNNEALRLTAEDERAANERTRALEEQKRVTAESLRASAEVSRKTAEEAREADEQQRSTAEVGRSSAEELRKSNEQSRISEETTRSNNEAARIAAETKRANAELTRKNNEDARQEAERGRVTAEQQRADAEAVRVEEFATFAATLAAKEDVANKVTSIGVDADDAHYPSAKAVKDKLDELYHKVGREEEIKRQSGYIDLSVGVGGIVDVTPKVSTSGFKYSFSEFPEGSYARMYGAGGSGASVRLWAILDKDYKILSVADAALNVTNLRIDAPEGSAYLVTNDQDNKSFFVFNGNSIELRKTDKDYVNKKIDSLSKRIDDLDKVNYETAFVDVDGSMLLNTRLNIDGSTSSNQSSYKVFVIDVEEGESYKIVQPKNLGSTGSALYALYSDRNFVLQNLMYVGKEFGNIQEEFFVIPNGCHYLLVGAVTTNFADTKKCVIKTRIDIISESSSKYKLFVKVDGNSIRVTKKYNTSKDFQVTINPCGASSLPQIYSFGWIENDSNIISTSDCANPVLSGSDWVMPWQLWSRENSTHVGYGFCGGWHGYNGSDCNGQNGNPTAVNDSVKFYADGIELGDGVSQYADEVKVIVKNRIMAQNSLSEYNGENDGYYVLEEIVTYLFKDNKIFISVIASALKNINVNLYYGLATNKFCSEIVYFGGSIKKATFDSASYFEEPCFSFACKDTANNYVIASMNSVGLGMYKHAKEDRYAMAFDYGKAYFSLIDTSKPLTLSIGDSLYWKGSLNFVDSLDIN